MTILVCRVAWMPRYQSDEETAVGGGKFVDQGNVPHESLNFLPVGDTYYGFVENGGREIELKNLGGNPGDETVTGVLVVFCAKNPETGELLVTGWYRHATVYRQPTRRPDDNYDRKVSFTATSATLVAESERWFPIPQARPGRPGGIGQNQFWYGLNEESARDVRELLYAYIGAPDLTWTPEEAIESRQTVESRQRRVSERLERHGAYRQFINVKGYRCEACDWSIDEYEREVWGSSFELHHLAPVHELEENVTRVVRIEDFAVLCASCHRAIHRTKFVSDVAGFAEAYLRE